MFLEIEWFARQYRPTVDRYLSTTSRALSLLESLERQSSLSTDDIDRLASLLGEVETLLYDRLAPHFDTEPSVAAYNEQRLSELRTLRERQDWDEAQNVLGGMVSRYGTLSTQGWVARTFPTAPAGGRLARLLTRQDAADRTGMMVYYAPTDYLGRVQADPDAYEGQLGGGRNDIPGYERSFDAVGIAAYRSARAYITFTDLTFGLRTQPVYVQQYRDAERAQSAVRRMLSASGAVSAEGATELGGQEWRQVFYQANGGVTYAFLLRTGRYLITAAPSQTAWDERSRNWEQPLALGWFWR